MKTYIPKLVKFAEYTFIQVILANHKNQLKANILKKRWEMSTSKWVYLKDKYIITTMGMHNNLSAYENAMHECRVSRGCGRDQSMTTTAEDIKEDREGNKEVNTGVIGALEERSMAEELNA